MTLMAPSSICSLYPLIGNACYASTSELYSFTFTLSPGWDLRENSHTYGKIAHSSGKRLHKRKRSMYKREEVTGGWYFLSKENGLWID